MPDRDSFPRWSWPLFAGLYALVIPWWMPRGAPTRLWLGLPPWVVTALLGGLAVALTVNLLIARYWDDEDDSASG